MNLKKVIDTPYTINEHVYDQTSVLLEAPSELRGRYQVLILIIHLSSSCQQLHKETVLLRC